MTVSISNLNFTWANSSNVFTAIGANVRGESNNVIISTNTSNLTITTLGNSSINVSYLYLSDSISNSNVFFETGDYINVNNKVTVQIADSVSTSNILIVSGNVSGNLLNVFFVVNKKANTLNSAVYAANSKFMEFKLEGLVKYSVDVNGNVRCGNVITNTVNANNMTANVMSANTITTKNLTFTVVTVANLPPASSSQGMRAFVSDANQRTFWANVFTGGSNVVPVFSDGTRWKIG